MSFDSIGYSGSINWAGWAEIAAAQGTDYTVGGADDLVVTIADASAGTVRVGPGSASGRGVTDTMVEAEQVLSGLTSPSTWYTVVVRRDWTPGAGSEVTTLEALAGGSSQAIAAARQVGAGVTDDQPLYLVHRGASVLDNVVDLRCWWGNGGVFAASLDALAYLGRDASVVHVGSVVWEKLPGASSWSRSEVDVGFATAGTLAVARGGTGAGSAADARQSLGITPVNIGAAPSWPARSVRYATATRGSSDSFAASQGFVAILAVGLSSQAPAGLWQITWTVLLEASADMAAWLRGQVGSTTLTGDTQFHCPGQLTLPTWRVHSGGAATLTMRVQVAAGTAVARAGSRIDAVWLGP